jgi:hypothetical protein
VAESNNAEVEVEQIMPRIRAKLAQRPLNLPGLHAPSALSRIVKHTVESACPARGWKKGDGFMLEEVPSADLRRLYTHARPTIYPSFAEGSDLVGVEVMISWGAVVASDIPVHREVNAEAAEYLIGLHSMNSFRCRPELEFAAHQSWNAAQRDRTPGIFRFKYANTSDFRL